MVFFFLLMCLIFNARVPGSSTFTSTSSPVPTAATPAQAPNPEPVPHSWTATTADGGRLSSDEGDADTPEDTDRPGLEYSSHHPQPSGVIHEHNIY